MKWIALVLLVGCAGEAAPVAVDGGNGQEMPGTDGNVPEMAGDARAADAVCASEKQCAAPPMGWKLEPLTYCGYSDCSGHPCMECAAVDSTGTMPPKRVADHCWIPGTNPTAPLADGGHVCVVSCDECR